MAHTYLGHVGRCFSVGGVSSGLVHVSFLLNLYGALRLCFMTNPIKFALAH